MPPLPELCPASHFWRLPSQFACSKISGFSVIGKSKFLSRERYLIISSFSLLALARKLQQRSRYFVWFTLQPIPCWFQLGGNISGLIRILYLHIMSCWKFGWRDLRLNYDKSIFYQNICIAFFFQSRTDIRDSVNQSLSFRINSRLSSSSNKIQYFLKR